MTKFEWAKKENVEHDWVGDTSWDGGPNATKDDNFLVDEIKKLVSKYNIEKIYETGTFIGGMTKEFSKICKEVVSIEINSNLLKIAQDNLAGIENIKLHHGSSPGVLSSVIEEKNDKVLFFLDAHWYNYIPLIDELKVISEKNIRPIIVIDDFIVPNKPEWGGKEPMDFSTIEPYLKKIYQDKFDYYYNEQSTNGRGRIFIIPT